MYPKEFGSRCWRLGNWPRPGRKRGGTRACGAGPADGREIERYVLFLKGGGRTQKFCCRFDIGLCHGLYGVLFVYFVCTMVLPCNHFD